MYKSHQNEKALEKQWEKCSAHKPETWNIKDEVKIDSLGEMPF